MTAASQIKSAARRRAMRDVVAKATGTRRRALLYLRQSLDRTGEGAGIERQQQACNGLCLARDWEVVAVIDDTISATDYRLEDRPGWLKAVGMIESGEIDVIVVYHLDRLTRSMKDLETLIDLAVNKGVGVATAQGDIDLTTDVGRMIGRILAAVAQAEGERKAERQILANDQRVAAGKPQWIRTPFGYTKDGETVEAEAAAIKAAYADVLKGKPLSTIADEWNAAGWRTSAPDPATARPRAPRRRSYNPTGEWNGMAVRVLLSSPRNAGLITQYGEVMGAGSWPKIVEEARWRAVRQFLAERERPDSKVGKLGHMLSGIARCVTCGATMQASRRGQDGQEFYVCSGRDARPGSTGRGHDSLDCSFADGQVLRRLVMRMEETGRVSFHPIPVPVDVEPLQKRLAELDEIMAELVAERSTGKIDRAAFAKGTGPARAEAEELRARIAEAGRSLAGVDVIDIEYAYTEFEDLDLLEQRGILRQAFDGIEIKGRGKGRPSPGEPMFKREQVVTLFSGEWGGHRPGARSTWG